MVDGLTGLFVRRYFDARIEDEIERSKRYGQPFSVVMMDIDDFKHLNDTHGHQVGDQVLRAVAQIVKAQMRGVDTATRYGGEEIALVLPRTEMVAAYNQAERIRAAIAEHRVAVDGGRRPGHRGDRVVRDQRPPRERGERRRGAGQAAPTARSTGPSGPARTGSSCTGARTAASWRRSPRSRAVVAAGGSGPGAGSGTLGPMTRERRRAEARVGLARLWARTKQILTTDPTGSDEDDRVPEDAAAEALARHAAELRGGMAKVAQLAAYDPLGLLGVERRRRRPDGARARLAALWDRAPGVTAAEVASVIEEDLGAPPERLFARWERTPIAAASLGQVHVAAGDGGEEYAVKVQYPAVAAALRDDVASDAFVWQAGRDRGRAGARRRRPGGAARRDPRRARLPGRGGGGRAVPRGVGRRSGDRRAGGDRRPDPGAGS